MKNTDGLPKAAYELLKPSAEFIAYLDKIRENETPKEESLLPPVEDVITPAQEVTQEATRIYESLKDFGCHSFAFFIASEETTSLIIPLATDQVLGCIQNFASMSDLEVHAMYSFKENRLVGITVPIGPGITFMAALAENLKFFIEWHDLINSLKFEL